MRALPKMKRHVGQPPPVDALPPSALPSTPPTPCTAAPAALPPPPDALGWSEGAANAPRSVRVPGDFCLDLDALASLDTPHPLLEARGLTEAARGLDGGAHVLTAEGAQLLRRAGVVEAAAGALVLTVYGAQGEAAGWQLWPSSSAPVTLTTARTEHAPPVAWAEIQAHTVLRFGTGAGLRALVIAQDALDALAVTVAAQGLAVGVVGLCGAQAGALGARVRLWAQGSARRSVILAPRTGVDGERFTAEVTASLGVGVQVQCVDLHCLSAAVLAALLNGSPVEVLASRSSARPAPAQRAQPVLSTPPQQGGGRGIAEGELAELVKGTDQVTGARCAALDGGGSEVASWSAAEGVEGGAVEVAATARRQRGDSAAAEVIEGGAVEVSLGCGVAARDDDASAKRRAWVPLLNKGGREVVRGLDRVDPPLRVGFPGLVDLLRSHVNPRFKHKAGPFIVGAVFGDGHRCGASLRRVTMLCLDIDGAEDLTPHDLEQRLDALGVAAVGYTTWSYQRGKVGLCARVLIPLQRPLDAPPDLEGRARVQHIGRQLRALVAYVGECLGVPLDGKALDKVSSQPEQLMYTPRHGAAWFYPAEGTQRAQVLARPFLHPDALPCGRALADLPDAAPLSLPLMRQDTSTLEAVASLRAAAPAAPPTLSEGDKADSALKRLQVWAMRYGVELGEPTPNGGGWKLRPPCCPSASGCADGAAFFVNADGSLGFVCHHNTCTVGRRGWIVLRAEVEGRGVGAAAEVVEDMGSLLASTVKWWRAKLGAVVADATNGGGTHGGGWAAQVLPLLRAARALAEAEHHLNSTQRDHCAAALADLAGAYQSIRAAAVVGAKDAEARADRLRLLRGAFAKAERQPMTLDCVLRPIQRQPFKQVSGCGVRPTTGARKPAGARAAAPSLTQAQRLGQAELEAVAVEVAAVSLTVARRVHGSVADADAPSLTANEERTGAGPSALRRGVGGGEVANCEAAEVVEAWHGALKPFADQFAAAELESAGWLAEVVASSRGVPALSVCVGSYPEGWHPPPLDNNQGEGCHLSVFGSSRILRDGPPPAVVEALASLQAHPSSAAQRAAGHMGQAQGEGVEAGEIEGGAVVEAQPVEVVEGTDQVTLARCSALDGGGGEVASWSAAQGAEGGAVGAVVEVVEAETANEGEAAQGAHGLKPAEDGGLSLCARFLPRDLFDLVGRVWRSLVLKSGQGTGKTEALVRLIEEARRRGERVLILTHRRELARSLAARLGARCYLDDKGRLVIAEGGALVLCVDSLKRLVMGGRIGESFGPNLVIVDESEQVARHLFGATVGDKLSVVAGDLFKVLKRAARVVCADADAGVMTQRLLVECAGRTQGLLNVTNTWQGWGFNLNGSQRVLLLKDQSNDGRLMLIDAVVEAVAKLGDGQTVLVACTSKTQANEIEKILHMNGCGDGVLVVTSATKDTSAARAFLADPNGCLPRVLIYSPTIGTGVSIDREVERVFVCGAAIEGFTGPDMVQLMTRARKQRVPPLVWLQDRVWDDMPRTRDDARAQLERLFDEVVGHTERAAGVSAHTRKLWRQRLIEEGLSGSNDDAQTFSLLVECLAETGRTGWSNVECTLEALAERGAEVIEVKGNFGAVESMREEAKEAREAMKDEAACAVVEAQPLPPDTDLDALRQTSTPEAHAACMRHDIEGRGVEVTYDAALAAAEGALGRGRALADAAAQLRGGVVAAYVAEGIRSALRACPARLPALAGPSRAARVVEVLQAAGLESVLTECGRELGEGWTADLNDAARIEAVRAYIEANRDALKVHGFSPPETDRTKKTYGDHHVKAWLVERLKSLGVMMERGEKPSSSQRARGKKRSSTLTRAAVVEAWQWVARPFAELVEAAELDAAEWAVVGGGLPL